MKRQNARVQPDLVVMAAGDLARRRFDPATRLEIINLLKVALTECGAASARKRESDDE